MKEMHAEISESSSQHAKEQSEYKTSLNKGRETRMAVLYGSAPVGGSWKRGCTVKAKWGGGCKEWADESKFESAICMSELRSKEERRGVE